MMVFFFIRSVWREARLRCLERMPIPDIANLESLLKERDKSLDKANNQVRGMSKLLEKKSEKQASTPVTPKTEEIAQKEVERKSRGNNGAKRNMHFEMETVKHDVYPDGMEGRKPLSTRETVRYEMILPPNTCSTNGMVSKL